MFKNLFIICLALTGSLAAETKILALAGSTRDQSYNKKLLAEAVETAKQMGATVTAIDLKDYPLPFYDADYEINEGMPANAKKLRQLMIASDAIIIASPEYNASISAVLKNALDWASRSENGTGSREAFKGKRFAIMSASPGKQGGARGLVHLRNVIEDVGGEVISLQVKIPQAHTAFDAEGHLIGSKQELKQEIEQIFRR